MRKRSFFSLVLSVFGVFFLFGSAQAASVDLVQFTVLNPDGDPVEGMSVSIVQDDFPVNFATTDASGVGQMSSIEEGSYTLLFTPSSSYDCAECQLFDEKEVAVTISTASAVGGTQNLGSYTMDQASRFVTITLVDNNGDAVVDGVPVSAFEFPPFDEFDPSKTYDGYAYGESSGGQFAFAVPSDAADTWGVSVDPAFATLESAQVYGNAYEEITVEADGETTATITLDKTDATITASLVDGSGDAVNVGADEWASVDCFEPWPEVFDPTFQSAWYNGQITPGGNTATINVVGGKTYECNGFMDGSAVIGGEVTVPENDNATIELTQLTYDAQITVRFTDSDGKVITDVNGAFDAFSVKDANGNEYWGDFQFADAANGKATLNAVDGYTYQVGGFIHENDGGFFGDPGGGDGDEFGDPGDFDGDPGDFGGDDSFEFTGFVAAAEGTSYIQNYERFEVVASADVVKKVDVTLQEADATITATVLDVSGDPVTFAWVDCFEADQEVKDSLIEDEFSHGWGSFVGGTTNQNGVAKLSVASGTYECGAFPENSFSGDVMPPARQVVTVKQDGSKKVTLQEVEADFDINVSVSTADDTELDYAYCYAFDPVNGFENFTDVVGGFSPEVAIANTGTLKFASGGSAYLGCMGYGGTGFFVSDEQVVDTSEANGSVDVAVVLDDAGTFYEDQTTTVSATTSTTMTAPDGESTLTLPADCLADSGNITVTIGSATGFKVNDDNYPVEAFNLTFQQNGEDIEEVAEGCSGLTWTQPYDEATLAEYGLNEDTLTGGGHYDADNKTWESPSSTTVDTEENTVSSTIKEFSAYSILGDKGLSTTKVTKPKKPKKKKFKAKKRKKKSAVLSWASVAGADSYKVLVQKRKKNYLSITKKSKRWKKQKNLKNIADTQKKVKKLKKGTTYRFKVRACNAAGCSKWTKYKQFKTKGKAKA